jgi:hypothetical protein
MGKDPLLNLQVPVFEGNLSVDVQSSLKANRNYCDLGGVKKGKFSAYCVESKEAIFSTSESNPQTNKIGITWIGPMKCMKWVY